MKKYISIIVAVVVILAGVAAYFYWQSSQKKPEPVQEVPQAQTAPPPPPVAPPPPPEPVASQVVEAAPEPALPPLPSLEESDRFVLGALSGLIENKALMRLFNVKRIIRHIVATIDNLPRRQVSMTVLPFNRVRGMFDTAGADDGLIISPQNASRYAYYVRIAQAADAKKLVDLYIRLYPLFQAAYAELGYPKKYFNDRLMVVLDDLLAAPNIKEPVSLVRPKVLYAFADPDLEQRSIGQRILMRIGSKNEAIVKARLKEIRQELMLRTQDKKVDAVFEKEASPAVLPEMNKQQP